ncbi:MAG: hypothetical protein PF690_14110 [Deltaproteobacteria bacterium]|jgi:uncharacterized protein with von Willebrand factor type A (vWA) domain|nr:hypothetical protein [Deltaproteobacteria bacterium]
MFLKFFYTLKEIGIPVSPTSFLVLQKALHEGMINTLDDFYTSARAILVKSERYFDLYDQVFVHHFEGVPLPENGGFEIDEMARGMLDEWLKNPKMMADALGVDEEQLKNMSPEELIEYFKKRLKDQEGEHHGGYKWIGTGGYSPVGHSGHHPGGMRVGGESRNKSAVKVANERRYKDYSTAGPLTQAKIGEALKRLRNMIPAGPMDTINIDETIKETMRNAGEIELVFERALKDKLKIILAIDNGGWSMDPYIQIVQTLFDYAGSQFKEVKTYFFHNTIYDYLWEDPARYKKPKNIIEFSRIDPDTRLIIVGDASMAPYELMAHDGSIHITERSGRPSMEQLNFMRKTFAHSVWLNPVSENMWGYTHTIMSISKIFPMYALSLDGLEKAVTKLMSKH